MLELFLILVHFAWARWRWHTLRGTRLKRRQNRRARRIVSYAHAHSPFYRQHWRGYDLRRWRRLPTMDKRLMMDHFSTFNTAGVTAEEAMQVALQAETSHDFTPTVRGLTVGLSSGTSGHRGLFLASRWEQAAWAGTILSRTIHKWRPRRLRVAFFLRANSNLYETIGGLLVKFRFFDLMLPLNEAIEQLNTFKPHIVVGPPSLLGLLAQSHAQGKLRAEPERLVSVAEVLEPQDRAYIESAFRAPVHQIYQCTEGLLAISCARGSLHVQEDLVLLQVEPLPGETALVTPIITDLWRTTQPIIRYRLNDVLLMSDHRCPCGSPYRVIEAIEGRCDDTLLFYLRAGGTRVFYPDTIRRMVLLAGPEITDYAVFQDQLGDLHVHIAIRDGVDFCRVTAQVQVSIATILDQYGCLPAGVTLEQGLPATAGTTKRRRIIRRWAQAVSG